MRFPATYFVVGVVLSFLLVPGAVGQTAALGIVQSASMDFVAAIPASAIQSNATISADCASTPSPPPPLPAFGRPESGNITLDTANRGFRFSESQTGTGCALAFFDLPNLSHESLSLSFMANRVVQQANDNASLEVVMPQEVWFMDRPGHVVSVQRYFRANEFSEPEQSFTMEFPRTGKGAQIGFYFEDRGPTLQQTLPNPGLGQAFSAEVMQIDLDFHGAPLSAVEEGDLGFVNGTAARLHIQTVNVTLPPDANASGFHLTVSRGPDLGAVIGPDGTALDVRSLQTRESGNSLSVDVPASVVATQGAGTYRFQFQTAFAYPPPPVVPTTIPWLPFLALGLVAVSGAIATPAAFRVLGATGGRAHKAARLLVLAVLLTWTAAAIIGVTMLSIGFGELTRLPLSAAAVAGYAVAFALIAAFVVELLRTGTLSIQQSLQVQERQAVALAQSNAELQSFAYIASHDLQEPLRKVASYSQLLEERYGKRLGKEGREFIAYTVDGSKRMQTLIRDVLAYSRIGQTPKPFAPVDLGKVVRRVVSDLEPLIQKAGATVEVGPLPVVNGDEGQLGQLFQNLVGNAVKFADRKPRVQVRSQKAGSSWEIRVSDNGMGIAKEHYDRIFQMFQRLHGPGQYGGTGIGLAICKKVVERHQGTITVESVVGKGTTFTVTLPGEP